MPVYVLNGTYRLTTHASSPARPFKSQQFEAAGDEAAREEVRRRATQHAGLEYSDLVLKRLDSMTRSTEVPL